MPSVKKAPKPLRLQNKSAKRRRKLKGRDSKLFRRSARKKKPLQLPPLNNRLPSQSSRMTKLPSYKKRLMGKPRSK